MNEKPAEKSKRLVKADLNFISQKPLEVVVQDIQTLAPKAVTAQVEWSEVDTALFQLTYTRDGRTTAEVSGQLRRWAGDMTHIYCDGRTFHKKISYVRSLLGWIVTIALISPFVMCPMAWFANSPFINSLLFYSFLAFMFTGIILGIINLVSYVLQATSVQRRALRQSSLSKPEKKDRERLLQFLTEIIRDEDYASQEVSDGEPLSDEEAATFLERAALMARLKKL
jgi:hypothetical protein